MHLKRQLELTVRSQGALFHDGSLRLRPQHARSNPGLSRSGGFTRSGGRCRGCGFRRPQNNHSLRIGLRLEPGIMSTHDSPARVACLPAGEISTVTARRPRFAAAFVRGWCWLLAALLGVSCSSKPKTDADWNSLRLWQQVASPPPTYVPKGYGANRPRTDRDGTWFTDPRDGKRLFVPKDGVRGWEPGVLAGEAKKATGYDGRPRLTTGEKLWWGTMFFLGGLARVNVPPPD